MRHHHPDGTRTHHGIGTLADFDDVEVEGEGEIQMQPLPTRTSWPTVLTLWDFKNTGLPPASSKALVPVAVKCITSELSTSGRSADIHTFARLEDVSPENRGLLMRENVRLALSSHPMEAPDEELTLECYKAVLRAVNPGMRTLQRVTLVLVSDSPGLGKLVTALRSYGMQVSIDGCVRHACIVMQTTHCLRPCNLRRCFLRNKPRLLPAFYLKTKSLFFLVAHLLASRPGGRHRLGPRG